MANDIVPTSKLPRAIAKEKDGVKLYWVEELGIAGLHQRGLADLLGCDHSLIRRTIASINTAAETSLLEAETVTQYGVQGGGETSLLEAETVTQYGVQGGGKISLLQVETVTQGGIQSVALITESDLPILLRHIARSKAKSETRDRADDIRDKLAAAGFRLMVMMELAPQELAARAVEHAAKSERIQSLELELAIQTKINDRMDRQDLRIAMHGLSTTLILEGKSDAVIEIDRPTIEIIDARSNSRYQGQTLVQVVEHLNKTRGIKIKSGKELAQILEKKQLGHLIAQAPRSIIAEYVPSENLEAVYQAIGNLSTQQLLLG